jgi:hypothetical protein
MKFLKYLLPFLYLWGLSINAQTKDSIQTKHEIFFKLLSEKGGVWIAQNPAYDSTNENDFQKFILKVNQKDALSIDAEILGVNTKKDTLTFWTFSEFYAPDKKKNLFYQRSTNGLYYAVGEATMTNKERRCEMTFYYAGGAYLKHKDIHTFIDEVTIESISYDFNTETNEWKEVSRLLWKRKLS